MISANGLKKGVIILLNGELYNVVEHQHVKPGKGGAFVRTKLRQLKKNIVIEKTFRSEEKIEDAYIERCSVQYLYSDGNDIVLMNSNTYEQQSLSKSDVGNNINFLVEGMELEIELYNDDIINIILPMFVEMEVIHTEPGLKGDSVSGANKPATIKTGYTLLVPLFISNGEKIKIDTRTGEYVERVN